ncbi:DNA repair protein RadC [bacterium]|nr:DNA repair protein RadC [bacterium]HMV26273.1 DNA repair protein RadC [bacterium]HMW33543.1 DNA repair protein RadC [bacterium]HMW35728.1 DNA repair protein RadC [bacterium]HMZ04474.1 DNA repair protein RadC [bacterium]
MGKPKKIAEPSLYHAKIKDWSSQDRPREKLEQLGAARLSSAELIAILIGSGTRNITAVDLARALEKEFSGLAALARCSTHELRRFKGIGKVKSIKLAAAFELSRRIEAQSDAKKIRVRAPEDLFKHYMPRLRDLNREIFMVVLLDSANQIIRDCTISEGTLNASLVHPREVFRAAIEYMAASIILVHNHPSGNPEPSREDIAVTEQLKEAGIIMSIPVRDHIIIAGRHYTSLAKSGYL